MGADAVHGMIKKIKKSDTLYTFENFVNLCTSAGQNILPVYLQICDFDDFKAKILSSQTKMLILPKLGSLCEVKFVKGSKCMYYRDSLKTEEFQQTPFLKAKSTFDSFLL